jgi:hypothetical protein
VVVYACIPSIRGATTGRSRVQDCLDFVARLFSKPKPKNNNNKKNLMQNCMYYNLFSINDAIMYQELKFIGMIFV